jgi:toxin HigB-1
MCPAEAIESKSRTIKRLGSGDRLDTLLHGNRVYSRSLIKSFGDKTTEDVFHGRKTARANRIPTEILDRLLRKLDVLNSAKTLKDLQALPGNALEELKGEKKGWHSLRVNDQWRIVFVWNDGLASQVQLTDYH